MKSRNIYQSYLSLLSTLLLVILVSLFSGCLGENTPTQKGNSAIRSHTFKDSKDNPFTLSLQLPDTVPVGPELTRFTLTDPEGNGPSDAKDYAIALSTQMQGMDHHGTHGSKEATYNQQGVFLGKVELIMKGSWEIHAAIYKNGEKISTAPIIFYITVI